MDRQPLYSRIADQLAQDIATGRYPVGTVLPSEPDLAVQLKVSRATVRSALASLESRKLVSRRKNAGTRVESDKPQGGYAATLSSVGDLIQWAKECARKVQKSAEVVLDQSTAKELGCKPGTRWLLIQSLRFDSASSKHAVSWTNAYVDERYAGVLSLVRARPSALMAELLSEKYGLNLATVEQEVLGHKIAPEHAKALGVQPEEAGLKVIRRYLTGEKQPVLVTVSIHPAQRFSIKTTLTRS
jgi:GntR family transcriptional regulator